MDQELRFHLTWIGLVCLVVICLICCITIFNVYEVSEIGNLVKSGVDPLRASCAVDFNADCKILYSK